MHKILLYCLLLGAWAAANAEDWKVPDDAAAVVSPVASMPNAVSLGAKVFSQMCVVCHGVSGKGDGPGGAFLVPKPSNLSDPAQWTQSDGALFWKITTGRNAMPAWKTILNDQQRWQVVAFLRSLSTRPAVK